MLSQVRTYLKNRISEIDSDFREWTEGTFDVSQIPETAIETYYKIVYGELRSFTKNDTTLRDEFPVTIFFYAQGYQNPNEAMDTLLDKVHDIRINAIKVPNATQEKFIKNVKSDGITPIPIGDTNSNLIQIELRLLFDILHAAR